MDVRAYLRDAAVHLLYHLVFPLKQRYGVRARVWYVMYFPDFPRRSDAAMTTLDSAERLELWE